MTHMRPIDDLTRSQFNQYVTFLRQQAHHQWWELIQEFPESCTAAAVRNSCSKWHLHSWDPQIQQKNDYRQEACTKNKRKWIKSRQITLNASAFHNTYYNTFSSTITLKLYHLICDLICLSYDRQKWQTSHWLVSSGLGWWCIWISSRQIRDKFSVQLFASSTKTSYAATRDSELEHLTTYSTL